MRNHGTYSAYQAHYRNGEKPCEECRVAGNAYARNKRRRETEAERAERIASLNARNRAAWRVVAAHPDEFARYVAEEMAS